MLIYTKFELPHINDRPTHPRLPRRRPLRAVRRPRPAAVERSSARRRSAQRTSGCGASGSVTASPTPDRRPSRLTSRATPPSRSSATSSPTDAAVLADTSKLGVLRCRAFFKVAMALDLLDGPETTAAADGSTAAA